MALGSVVDVVATRVGELVCGLFTGGGRRVSEWGALALQGEARELEQLLSSFLPDGSRTLAQSFSRLAQAVLLLNLDRPADLALYPVRKDVMTADEVRAVLGARFSPALCAQVRLPWEDKAAAGPE